MGICLMMQFARWSCLVWNRFGVDHNWRGRWFDSRLRYSHHESRPPDIRLFSCQSSDWRVPCQTVLDSGITC